MKNISQNDFVKMILEMIDENEGALPSQDQWNKIVFNSSKVDMSNTVNYDIIIETISKDIYEFLTTKNPLVFAFLKSNNIGFEDIKNQIRKIIKGE